MPGFELVGQEEAREVAHIFENGGVLFRQGFEPRRNGVFKVREFEAAFARDFGTAHALAVSSGTAALRVALAALGIRRGDEVITQAFTFVATVEAIVEAAAKPVIAEIDEYLNLCPKSLEKLITPRTKAIIVVHMLGVPAQMDAILKIADAHKIPVIEDTAWGCGGEYRGKRLGTLGALGTFSFDYAKAMTTGEGGMVVTASRDLDHKGRAYQDHGHDDNPAVPRWEDTRSSSGFNYRMTELQGAVGLAQLKKLSRVIEGQRAKKAEVESAIRDISGVRIRPVPEGGRESADALVFQVPSKELARACRTALLEVKLATKILPEAVTWHFAGTWTHIPEITEQFADFSSAFAESRARLDTCVSLPVNLTADADMPERVRRAVRQALG